MDELNKRERRKKEILKKMKNLNYKIKRYQAIVQDFTSRFNTLKKEFNTLDYELAMENRTIIPSRKTTVRKTAKAFTIDEIKSIAIKLGVEITIKEEGEK